jgi:hypothetical protein
LSHRCLGSPIVLAVVVTVTVASAALVPLRACEAGLIVHVAPIGAPEQLSAKVPLAPLGVNARSYVAACPAVTDWLVEEPLAAPVVKSSPVPDSATLCGLPEALSARVTAPVLAPPAVGVNVTLIKQLPLGATGAVVLHVVPLAATLKSPVAAIVVKFKA